MTGIATPEEIHAFWFPEGIEVADEETTLRQVAWWFRGGADPEIVARFGLTLEAAISGQLDVWAKTASGRLALILVLDQFPRSVYRDDPRAYAQDPKAAGLVLEGLANGDYEKLKHFWEKTFFALPFSHSEDLALHDRCVPLVEALIDEAPAHLRKMLEFSAGQARGHRDVVARFGRHPHRNRVLGRESTPEELEHLASTVPVHQRTMKR